MFSNFRFWASTCSRSQFLSKIRSKMMGSGRWAFNQMILKWIYMLSHYYTMINSQQYSLSSSATICPQKISLKTTRVNKLGEKTKRTSSFQHINQAESQVLLSGLTKEESSMSSLEGMFRYCKLDKNCCGFLNPGKSQIPQAKIPQQKYQTTSRTSQSGRSSFSTQDKSRRRSQGGSLSVFDSDCAKINYAIPTQNRLDNIGVPNFIMEYPQVGSLEFIQLRQQTHSECLYQTQRFDSVQTLNNPKFSLKTLRSNLKIGNKNQPEKFNNQELTQYESLKSDRFRQDKDQAGCLCLPQCFWIDKWEKLIKKNFRPQSSASIDPKVLSQIDKDSKSTHAQTYFFKEFKNQHSLKQTLINYSLVNGHQGYYHGMSFIASAVVYHSKNVLQSSAIFNFIMKQKQYQKIYEKRSSMSLAKNLLPELKKYEAQLYSHIIKIGSEVQTNISNCYLSMLSAFVPLDSMHLIIDKFIKKGFKGISELLLSLLIYFKDEILSLRGQEIAAVFTIEWLRKRSQKIDWLQIMGFSQNIAVDGIQI